MVTLFKHEAPLVTEAKQIPSTFTSVESFKSLLKEETCPTCHVKGDYYLVNYQKGPVGWEAKIICSSCKTDAVINQTGFHFNFSYRPVKA